MHIFLRLASLGGGYSCAPVVMADFHVVNSYTCSCSELVSLVMAYVCERLSYRLSKEFTNCYSVAMVTGDGYVVGCTVQRVCMVSSPQLQ